MNEKEKKDPRPLCKLCNTRHWSYEPHAWEKRVQRQPGLNKKTKKKSKRKKKR